MKKLIIAFMLLYGSANASQWITGYYPSWYFGSAGYADQMDFSKFTHIIIFPAQDALAASPYFNDAGVTSQSDFATIITRAHAAGCKVLFSITGGGNHTNFSVMANDAAKTTTYIDACMTFLVAHSLDGIDIDWEFPWGTDKAANDRLIRIFRQRFNQWNPHGVMTCATHYIVNNSGGYDRDSMLAAYDQINLMSYTMWMGPSNAYIAGFDTPVDMPTTNFPSYGGVALNSPANSIRSYQTAGWGKTQIGIGITLEATHFYGTTGFNTSYSSFGFDFPQSAPTSGRVWDNQAKAYYVVNGAEVWSFPDTNSVKAVAQLARDSLYGGVMIYNVCKPYENYYSPKDVLVRAINAVVGGANGTYTPPSTGVNIHTIKSRKHFH